MFFLNIQKLDKIKQQTNKPHPQHRKVLCQREERQTQLETKDKWLSRAEQMPQQSYPQVITLQPARH